MILKDLAILKRNKEHFKGKYNYISGVDDKTPNYYNYMNRPGKTSQIDFYNFLKSFKSREKNLRIMMIINIVSRELKTTFASSTNQSKCCYSIPNS